MHQDDSHIRISCTLDCIQSRDRWIHGDAELDIYR